jgi:Transposase IS116/IS110/IS902 family
MSTLEISFGKWKPSAQLMGNDTLPIGTRLNLCGGTSGSRPLVSSAMLPTSAMELPFAEGATSQAWVGVVPRQYSTGGKQKLLGISKRGNIYLRRMLIHGARAVLFRIKYDTGGFGQ